MAVTNKKTFLAGAASTTQATALSNFQTVIDNLANGTGGVVAANGGIDGINIINAGVTVASDTTVAATYSYVYWAFAQYSQTT